MIARTVDVGQTVAASLQAPELFKIAQDLRRIRIEAQVNEADVGAVSEGNPVEFTRRCLSGAALPGQVAQVGFAATELNNVVTYTVIIEAANDNRRLLPGMTANVQMETAKGGSSPAYVLDALRFKPRGARLVAARATRRSSSVEREIRAGQMRAGVDGTEQAATVARYRGGSPGEKLDRPRRLGDCVGLDARPARDREAPRDATPKVSAWPA